MNNRTLILGGSGFLGNHLTQGLSENHSFAIESVSSKTCDLLDPNSTSILKTYFQSCPIVIVCAAITRDRGNSPTGLFKNITMAHHIAQALGSSPIRHLIYISTVDVYGRTHLELPLSEASPLHPEEYYAISKLTSETILSSVCSANNIPLTILRLPSLYGPGDTHQSTVRSFLEKILKNEPIQIHGDGCQVRDFLYVRDVSQIMDPILQNRITGCFNLVTGISTQIIDLVRLISEIASIRSNLVFETENPDFTSLKFDNSKLRHAIPNLSFTSLPQGLKETYDS